MTTHLRDWGVTPEAAIHRPDWPDGVPRIIGLVFVTQCGKFVHRVHVDGLGYPKDSEGLCPDCLKAVAGKRCDQCGELLEPERAAGSDNCGCRAVGEKTT